MRTKISVKIINYPLYPKMGFFTLYFFTLLHPFSDLPLVRIYFLIFHSFFPWNAGFGENWITGIAPRLD